MMKTCFITNGIHRVAGTEKVITQLAYNLKDIVIVVPGTKNNAFENGDLNVLSANLDEFPESGIVSKIYHRYKYFIWLKNLIKNNSFDNIVSFTLDLNIVNIILCRIFSIKCVVCEHIEYDYHNGFLRSFIRKLFYRIKGVNLVCLTKTDAEKFKKDYIYNIKVIPNFIIPVDAEYNRKSKRLLAVGRLEYQKNFSFLIRAFILSGVYNDGWTLHIYGEGSEKDNLNKIIREHKMQNFITINNFERNISSQYLLSSGLCMTSRFEAFPMVLLEAMNHSLPVLITNFPTGAKEILGEYNSQIIKEYDEYKYAKALCHFCANENFRLHHSLGNKDIIKSYYPGKIISLWNDLLSIKMN